MDDLSIQGAELERVLAELAVINRGLGGYGPSLEGLESLWPKGQRVLSVLDVGTGGADTPRQMVQWAREKNLQLQVLGIDLTPTTIDFARQSCAPYPEIRIEQRDLFHFSDEPQFDVVHAAAVLHHFPGATVIDALRKMYRVARLGVVINDLHRSWLAWGGFKMLSGALSRSRLVKHDGPLSVLRAFTAADLRDYCRQGGLPAPEVHWRPMFRWRMIIRRPGRF